MTIKKFILILIMFSFFLACNKTPIQIDQVELREDLSESEFKEAIIGKWVSVYEIQGKENVEYLELNRNGEAKIIIKKIALEKNWKETIALISFVHPQKVW